MGRLTCNDTVRVKPEAPQQLRPGALASVVGVHEGETRWGKYMEQFPAGAVYTIEFEDGSSVNLHESLLEKGKFPVRSDDRRVGRPGARHA